MAFFQDNLGKLAPEPFQITKQEIMWRQWHQLDHLQIIYTSLQKEITTPAPHHSILYRPDALTTNSVKSLKAIQSNEGTVDVNNC